MQDLGRLFCPKKYVGGRHFIKQVQEKQTRKSFREVVSTREVYGKNDVFLGLKIFRVLWETPESRLGSFAGRFPGPRSFRVFWETHARPEFFEYAQSVCFVLSTIIIIIMHSQNGFSFLMGSIPFVFVSSLVSLLPDG